MTDSFDLLRFVDAQSPAYSRVVDELRGGRKRSHWMWFVFPQIAGLGHSAMAQRFAISSIEKALAYLAHPLLGSRLRECTALVNAAEGPVNPGHPGKSRRPEIPLIDDAVQCGLLRSAILGGPGKILRREA